MNNLILASLALVSGAVIWLGGYASLLNHRNASFALTPEVAAAADCPDNVTPFNGDHTAGIQVLSTRTFGATTGPLRSLAP